MSSQAVTLSDIKSPNVASVIAETTMGLAQASNASTGALQIVAEHANVAASSLSTPSATALLSSSITKRAFDIVFAFFVIVSMAPLFLVIAIALKLSSRGPVVFRQERVGKGGKAFTIFKFRTMRVAEKAVTDTRWSGAVDPRKTRIGALLRHTNLDELPQFFNVLFGQMSIVGPRPERPYFVDKFAKEIPNYTLRHRGEVGITGWAQVHGLRGDTCIRTRLAYDLEYLENRTLQLDLKIICLTVAGFLFRSGPKVNVPDNVISISAPPSSPEDVLRAA